MFSIDISGKGNVIDKNIAFFEMVNLDSDMLKEIPSLYAETLKNFCQSLNEQLTRHNIQKPQISLINVARNTPESSSHDRRDGYVVYASSTV